MADNWGFLPKFDQIRWGPGVVGRTSVVAAITVLAIVGALYVVDDPFLVTVLVFALIGLPLLFLALAYVFAFTHPELSVMEGGEALAYRQAEMAAKLPQTIDLTPGRSANTSPPQALTHLGGSNE